MQTSHQAELEKLISEVGLGDTENVPSDNCNTKKALRLFQQYCSGILTTIKEYGIIQHIM